MLGFKTRPKPGQWGKYVAVALTTSACSLQDYTYLGAGDPNTDTSEETSTDGSETTGSDASDVSMTDTVDIDASVPEGGIDDGGDMTGPDLTDQTDTTMVETTDTTAVDTTDVDASDMASTTDEVDAGPEPPLVVTGNLIPNSSFENPNSVWYGFGNSSVVNTLDRAHTGVHSLHSTARKEKYEGPATSIMSVVTQGESYVIRAWVQSDDGVNSIQVSVKTVCREVLDDAGVSSLVEYYDPVASVGATSTSWHELNGLYVIRTCDMVSVDIYFELPPGGVEFYIDDVSLVPN